VKLKHAFLFFVVLSVSSLASHAQSGPVCTPQGWCPASSQCVMRTGLCACNPGHIDDSKGNFCAYQQKNQLTAFLLNFFVAFGGAGMFYAGQYGEGAGQLVLFVGSTLAGLWGLAAIVVPKSLPWYTTALPAGIGIAGYIGGFGWWLANNIRFGKNEVNDENGQPLKAW